MGDGRFHRRRLALGLALGASLLSPLARAQTDKPRRIGVLYPLPRGGRNNMAVFFDGMKELGYVEGRNLVVERRFSDGDDALEQAFSTMRRERLDAHVVLAEPRMDQMRARLVELAVRHRLPGIYMWRFYADAGGLMSYGPNLRNLIALWPGYVDKILKGVPPGEIPVQTPTRYELVLNNGAAKAMGFTFPGSLVVAADAVIN